VENKGIGIRIDDPAPDFAMLARAQGVDAFGPVTEPGDVGAILDQAIALVEAGKPVVIDVHTTAR
jgi:thiamine pyrophosphate-dependent acetolactate synthase large subunit-like protein